MTTSKRTIARSVASAADANGNVAPLDPKPIVRPGLTAALAHAQRGWPVLPILPMKNGACTCRLGTTCKSPGKHPMTVHGLKDATRDTATIESWWNKTKTPGGLGIATGTSAGFWVLDIDGPEGEESLRVLRDEHGPLPITVEQRTGRPGGRHIFFAMPPTGDVRNSESRTNRLGAKLEARGTGGYIVVAPSPHASGRSYEWAAGRGPHEVEIAPAPEWLLRLVQKKSASRKSVEATRAEEAIPDGQRNNDLTSFAGSLRRAGASYEEIEAALQARNAARCVPPLDPAEVTKIALSVSKNYKEGDGKAISLEDFVADMESHTYIYLPTDSHWPAPSVNSQVAPVKLVDAAGNRVMTKDGKTQVVLPATAYLDQFRHVEASVWWPGEGRLIRDRVISREGGWISRPGTTTYNRYRPPTLALGDASKAGPYVELLARVLGEDVLHFTRFIAHRVQKPGEKINHGVLLGGPPGIGKDSMLEPVKHAVGPWNFNEVSPAQVTGRFTGFAKSVVLRVNELRDLGDVDRYSFYEHMKVYLASPPDVLRVDEKHIREYAVVNVCGVLFTTNHKTDGLYLPADDRRHHVIWSPRTPDDFPDGYWTGLWRWYADGGIAHAAAYLAEFDLSGFDAKAPPPKTAAFYDIVNANRAPEEGELADIIDSLEGTDALTLNDLVNMAPLEGDIRHWLKERRNRRAIPHRLESVGYVPFRNDAAGDGLWKIDGVRQVVYVRRELSQRDAADAVRNYKEFF